ncbi:MAG TPA: DUF2946 family protein [Steroidobacteraceae bacterium]|nr:DUF2946 family protein [Steroidobacteraceae bacterium]
MTPVRKHRILWLLLPLLALRGLVPAGYMIDATEHGLSIVVCESGIYGDLLASDATKHHHGHHTSDSHRSQHDHSICPFAIAATGAPAPSAVTLATVVDVAIDRVRDTHVVIANRFGPSRAQQSRAPPYFS